MRKTERPATPATAPGILPLPAALDRPSAAPTSRRAPIPAKDWIAFALLSLVALAVHAALVPTRGWERDQYWFHTWMSVGAAHGAAHVAERVWCDYPPLHLYILEAIGRAWTFVTGLAIPPDGSIGAKFLLKIPAALATIATAALLFEAGRARRSAVEALCIAAAYALNPALLLDGAVWGQVDALLAFFVLLAIRAAARDRVGAAFAWLAVALLFKQQAIVVVPIFVLFAIARDGLRGLLDGVRGLAVAAFVLLLPFYAAGTTGRLLATLMDVTNRYPFVSLNAHNAWWLAFGPRDLPSDALRIGNAAWALRSIGFVAFATAIAAILARLWRALRRPGADTLVCLAEACALAFLAFYLFPTQIHERYVVPALAFVALLCAADRRAWWVYGALSVAVAISLASTLASNYPQPLGPLSPLLRADRGETFAVAWVLLAAFAILFARAMDRTFLAAAGLAAGAVAAAVFVATRVPRHAPVRLSEWEPIAATQDWGVPQRNASVDGRRLSALGFIFRDGIGTHAVSRLVYPLAGAFRRFESAFGVDDESRRGQRTRFRVLVDGAVRFDSGNVAAEGFPRHLDVDVTGGRMLTLEVLDGGDGIDRDHADWLAPTLFR